MVRATITTAKQDSRAQARNAGNGQIDGSGIFKNRRVMEEAHNHGLVFGNYRVYVSGKRGRLEFWKGDAIFTSKGSEGEKIGKIEGDEKRIIVSVLSRTRYEPLTRTLVFDITGESPKLARTIRTRKDGSIELRTY